MVAVSLHNSLGDHGVGDFYKARDVGAHHIVLGMAVLLCRRVRAGIAF